MHAIQFSRTGDPDVLELAQVQEPALQAGALLVDVIVAGVSILDTRLRAGSHPATLPLIPGQQAVGLVRAVGPGVTGFKAEDRITWMHGSGTYAEMAIAPAATAVVLPYWLPDEAGLFLADGLVAHYLAHDVVDVAPGRHALVHTVSGDMGLLLVRMLKNRSIRIIATVARIEDAPMVQQAGADTVLVRSAAPLGSHIRALTGGRGVDVVFDGFGHDADSAASLRDGGTVVLHGQAAGVLLPHTASGKANAGAAAFRIERPDTTIPFSTRAEFEARTEDLFRWLNDGRLDLAVGRSFPLAQAAEAHRALEAGMDMYRPLLRMHA